MNLPNKLSLLRVAMVPFIVLCFLYVDLGSAFELTINSTSVNFTWQQLFVLLLFALASFTDFLDGNIARKRNLITSFGKFVDPIADKLLVNTMFILFAVTGKASIIAVLIMIWRDMIVDGLRMNASAKGVVVAAGWLGKCKTVLQMIAIIVILLFNMPFEAMGLPVDQILIWAATIVSLLSGIQYFVKLKDIVMESM